MLIMYVQQYWAHADRPYKFVPISEFLHAYQKTDTAKRMQTMLDMPYDRASSPEGALVRTSLLNVAPVDSLMLAYGRELLLLVCKHTTSVCVMHCTSAPSPSQRASYRCQKPSCTCRCCR
jgi:hypothetical protein